MEDGFDILGADEEVGFDYGSILQAGGGLATAAISSVEQDKKAKADKAADQKKTNDVIAADQTAANAMAQADFSAATAAPSMVVDTQAAQLAVMNQDRTAAGLSAEGQKKRAEAADKALDGAIKASQANPTDKYRAALVRAWTAVANKAHSGAIAGTSGGASGFDSYGQSWFTRPVGNTKIPGYGVLLIGAGVLTAVGVAVKKFFFSKVAG